MMFERIKELRQEKKLTQTQVAELLGIDQRVYSNYETGKREIPSHHLIELAKAYEISLDYLVGLSDIRERR